MTKSRLKSIVLASLLWFTTGVQALAETEIDVSKAAKNLQESGKFEEELTYLDQKLNAFPKNAKLWAMRAEANCELQEYERSIEDATKALSFDSKCGTAYLARGMALKGMGKFNESIADLKKAVENDKSLIRAYLIIGINHIRLKQWDDAIQNLNKLVKLDKSKKFEAPAKFFRGAAYGNLHKYDLAVQDFESVMKTQPENKDAQAMLKKYRPFINKAKKELKKSKDSDTPWDDK